MAGFFDDLFSKIRLFLGFSSIFLIEELKVFWPSLLKKCLSLEKEILYLKEEEEFEDIEEDEGKNNFNVDIWEKIDSKV